MSNAAIGILAIGFVGVGVYVYKTATSDEHVYEQPLAATFATLAALPPVPRGVDNLVGMYKSGVDATVDNVPNQSVTWHFTMNGHEFGRYSALLTEKDPARTSVQLKFEDIDPNVGDDKILQLADFPFMRGLVTTVIGEHINSALDGRPFDRQAVSQAFAARAALNPAGFQRGVAVSMESAAHEMDREDDRR
jgi:hypothetical protein